MPRTDDGTVPTDRPSRVLLVTQPTDAGTARHVADLAQGLSSRGVEVSVACPSGGMLGRRLGEAAIPVVELPMRREISPLSDLVSFARLYRLCRVTRPDIVHLHSSKAGFLGRIAGRLAGVPVVVFTPHCWSFQSVTGKKRAFYIRLERFASRFCDVTITVSEHEALEAVRCRVVVPQRVRVIPNGLSPESFAPSVDRKRDIPFVSVGRLDEQKGYTYLLAAMAELVQVEPGARLSIIGSGSLRGELEAQCASLGLQDVVILEGEQEDVRSFLERAHVFVSSSLWEGLPFTIIEAMAMGLPVVSTDVGGCGELVSDGETGRLVPARDPSALASAMRELWRDDTMRLSMGDAGFERASRYFRIESCVAQNADVYDKFLANSRHAGGEQRGSTRRGIRLLAITAAITVVLLGGLAVLETSTTNEIASGITVGGAEVGGLTRGQAIRVVDELSSRPVTVSVTATSAGIPVAASQLNLDVRAALGRAYLVGRVGALPQRIMQRFAAYRGEVSVPIAARNEAVVAGLLADARGQLDRPATDARFVFEGGELKIAAEQPGVRVAEDEFLALLGTAATSPGEKDRTVQPPVESLPAAVTLAQLARFQPEAREWTDASLAGSTAGRRFALSRDELAALLTVSGDELTVSETRTVAALDRMEIPSTPPRDARLAVVNKKVQVIDGAPGTQIDASATAQSIQAAMESGESGFSVVMKNREPDVKRADLERLGIDRELSSYTTEFRLGLDGRDANIALAAAAIRGKVLGPGEVFSLNSETGPRNRATGYKEALVFSNGKVVPGIGGGVCQVSSTTYQAALRAGLGIVDRRSHSMAVSYVKPGLDATAYYPTIDLKFQNTTGAPVMLWTEVRGNKLNVGVYGSGAKPAVDIETVVRETTQPRRRMVYDSTLAHNDEVVEVTGRPGYVVTSYRLTYKDGVVVRREELATDEYQPRDWVIRVGT